MPKIVDHDQRRGEIVDAYLSVVGRDGPAAASSRAIAAELGVGAGALWHYFDSLDAVVAAACRQVLVGTDARIAAATEGRRGLTALDAMLREIMPMARHTRDEAKVVVGFWGRLAVDRQITAGQADALDMWGARVRRHLGEAVEDGELVRHLAVDCLADVLLSIAVGQQVHAVLDAEAADPQRQHALVQHCLKPWRNS
ncbi:TetR/AcrR family transcriptional regulator [Actinoplanes sp. TRM 88003]|uniref:TetR/AcrR family transcriptional regulator n=1 Tax=Paractinoplanes aksuensis TaxID=2939490 RepID=A0ABT1DTS1_9ACTN|nr:TetR/AcrR family transcriptional regulator [Actinoplanes aksuensis]MCO8274249.1 TetR/AcrR family transcriptional regulator [Actinoplanes aksuensis]